MANNEKILSVERQFFKLIGETVRTFDQNRQLLCKAEQKAFKLREEITFFGDEEKTKPLFKVQARRIVDIAATYDITDAASGQRIASLRRKGLASTFVRDEWLILDAKEQQVGTIEEESAGLGILRRYVDLVSLLIPQKFVIRLDGQPAGHMQLNRFMGVKLQCHLSGDVEAKLGPVLALAIPSMMALIEGRQN